MSAARFVVMFLERSENEMRHTIDTSVNVTKSILESCETTANQQRHHLSTTFVASSRFPKSQLLSSHRGLIDMVRGSKSPHST